MKILDFPNVRQSTVDTCSCACVQACLCYYGINQREGQVRELMQVEVNPDEVRPEKMVEALEHFGLTAQYAKFTREDLIAHIEKSIPVILNLQAWAHDEETDYSTDDNGHYAVAIGYDKKGIIFSDPANFYKTFLSYKELEKRWHDGYKTDADYDHMGVAVLGDKPVYKNSRIVHMK